MNLKLQKLSSHQRQNLFGLIIYIILMNITSGKLSQGFIYDLYVQNKSEIRKPLVQIIDFQESQINDKQITIRISDGLYFIDCTLSGNYQIKKDMIVETKNSATVATIRRYQFITLMDFFSKIDDNRICKLKIIIRKIVGDSHANELIGTPQEICQFVLNSKNITKAKDNTDQTVKKQKKQNKQPQNYQYHKHQQNAIKIENGMEVQDTVYQTVNQIKIQKKDTPPPEQNNNQALAESLSLNDILNGKQGFLIGRLSRFKTTRKETKDGPMTVCYLGFLDKNNQLIRVHLAGRLAMNNEKTLRKNKCYYVRGFDVVKIKNAGNQIRLKDKQYKIVQIHNEQLTKNLSNDYFHLDHESDLQNEYIDVIGIVDDIEQKASYTSNSSDSKSVIRVVVKNKFKSIRISFWTDQIKTLESFNLKRKDFIMIEDVKKKQSKYYDFGFESNLIQLSEHPFLQQKFKDLLPQIIEELEPQNVKQLAQLYIQQPNNNKLRTLTGYLTHRQENNIIYRLCDECKKKVQKNSNECQDCGGQNLSFKYNCPLQFSDSTGSITTILFDTVAQRLIGKTANEINQMTEDQIEHIFQSLFYRSFSLTIENRNQRYILRSFDCLSQTQEANQLAANLAKINLFIANQIW